MNIIKNNTNSELIIKKSKFIGYLYQIDNINDINNILNNIRLKYPDATHICYAYITLTSEKAYDDKEPNGTAGIPISDILKKHDLTNTLGIVVRYYGGIKLGVGGLIRAYRTTIKECINKTEIIEYKNYINITLESPFNEEKKLNNITNKYQIINKEYNDKIYYKIKIAKEELNNLKNLLKNTNIKIKEENK